MIRHSKKVIFLFLLLTVISVALVYLVSGVSLRIEEVEGLKSQIAREAQLPGVEDLRSRMEMLSSKIPRLNSFLIDSSDPIALIESIENSAASHGLLYQVDNAEISDNFSGSNKDDGTQNNLGGRLTMTLTVDGPIDSIRRLISSLENFEKEIFVDSLRLTKITSEEGENWNAVIIIIGITN